MQADDFLLGVLVVAAVKRKQGASSAGDASDAAGYVNGAPVTLDLVAIDSQGHRLRRDAAMAYYAMVQAAARDRVQLVVNTAFRTWAEQERLYELYKTGKGNLAAPPGYSNHQGGVALDIETASGTNAAFKWLNARAYVYGYRRTVASEPWHWEFSA